MKLVWLDLETTGLDPHDDAVLEIAMRLSDGTQLDERAFFSRVVRHDGRQLSPFIHEMHTKNGLLDEATQRIAIEAASTDYQAVSWLQTWIPDAAPRSLTLAGSSVHFDLGFLRVHMPGLAALFSHRLFDVSAIKLFCESLGMPKIPKAEAHRAMADVNESFAHYAVCAGWIKKLEQALAVSRAAHQETLRDCDAFLSDD